MASGKAHAIASAAAGGVALPLLLLAGAPFAQAGSAALGCLAGLVINPDLDMRHPTISESIVRQSAGRIAEAAWYLLWWPYARFIPYHRHLLSHLPLIGTLLRVLYLLLILGILYWWVGLFTPLPSLVPVLETISPYLWWFLGGLACSDSLHALMDVL